MSAEISFITQIAKIKRRVVVKAAQSTLLNAGLIFLGLQLVLWIAAITGWTDSRAHDSWYIVSVGISVSTAIFIGFVTRRNFLNILVEIDRRLKLQDRLSTAYEYLKFKKDSEFTDLLMQDATAELVRLNSRQLLPSGFSWRHLICILLLLANLALYTINYPVLNFKSARAEQKTIEQAAELLRNYTFSRIDKNAGSQIGRQTAFSRKLEQLGNQLYNRSLTSEQVFTALTDTLKEVQAERTRLTDELASRLNAAGSQAMSVRQIPALENLSPDQLAELKGLLNKALNNRIPDAVNEDIESLQELDSIAKLLSRIMDDVKKDRSEVAESAIPAEDEIQTSQIIEGLDDVRDDPQQSIFDGRTPAPGRNSPDRAGEAGSGQLQKSDGPFQDDGEMRQGDFSSAGSAKSVNEMNSSTEIQESTGPAVQEKMASSPMKSYLVHIRALTDIGEARLKEEDIIRTYGQAVESILQKEDIPLNYREYIKNYFMAIGLNTEE
ncbi:MAG: hypothetical protein JSW26_15915 [Desulfobacterales bacterium]|nr:MAG: hypothetical protein JSW26_15915 [Desulfobacterales bacterium]